MDRNRDKKKIPSEQGKKQSASGNKKSTRPTTKAAGDSKQSTRESTEERENDSPSTDADSGADDADVVAEQIPSTSLSDKNRTKKIRDPVLRPPKTLETTLFDRLEKMYGSAIKRMLQIQYR